MSFYAPLIVAIPADERRTQAPTGHSSPDAKQPLSASMRSRKIVAAYANFALLLRAGLQRLCRSSPVLLVPLAGIPDAFG